MENNTTFSNRESLQQRIPTLPANDTFSNKVSLQSILALSDNSTFANDVAFDTAVITQKVPDKKPVTPKDGAGDGASKS